MYRVRGAERRDDVRDGNIVVECNALDEVEEAGRVVSAAGGLLGDRGEVRAAHERIPARREVELHLAEQPLRPGEVARGAEHRAAYFFSAENVASRSVAAFASASVSFPLTLPPSILPRMTPVRP